MDAFSRRRGNGPGNNQGWMRSVCPGLSQVYDHTMTHPGGVPTHPALFEKRMSKSEENKFIKHFFESEK